MARAQKSTSGSTPRNRSPKAAKRAEPGATEPRPEELATVATVGIDAPAPATDFDEVPLDAVAMDLAPDAPHSSAPLPSSQPGTSYPTAAPKGSGGEFLAGLVGGALAVAVGGVALFAVNPAILAGAGGDAAVMTAPLAAGIEAQADRSEALSAELATLRAELEALRAAAPTNGASAGSEFAAEIEALRADVETVSAALDVLEGRVSQVEARPPVLQGDAAGATAEIISDMRAALDAQRAEIAGLADAARAQIEAAEAEAAALQASVSSTAKAAVARAAFSRLQAALDAGGPFTGALSDLSSAVEVPIPEALMSVADTGVPTLAELQRSFPEPARAALAASIRAGVDEAAGPAQRIGAFLRAQTGARSTVPRAGDDPDAVLSRAEAALREGRLAETFALIAALPEPGQAALAGWQARAETRAAAVGAAATLAATLSSN